MDTAAAHDTPEHDKPAHGTAAHDKPRLALRAVAAPLPLPTKLCPDGHPNNPDSESCMDCEFRFAGAAVVTTMAPRPVARLLLEDGTAVDVADDLLLGRSPIDNDALDTLTIAGRQVSRRHLLLKTDGWQLRIQDCDSTNGTFLSRRGERGRRRVPSECSVPVRIGDSIHFGSRQALVVRAR